MGASLRLAIMSIRVKSVVSLLVGASLVLSAHDVFFNQNHLVARDLAPGRQALHLMPPRRRIVLSLTSFEEARPWAKAIKEEVLERRMPPFAAVKGFGDIRDDQALTQDEIHLISDWVEGGSPEGDPALLAKNPHVARPALPPTTSGVELIVDGNITLKHALIVSGIRPEGASRKTAPSR